MPPYDAQGQLAWAAEGWRRRLGPDGLGPDAPSSLGELDAAAGLPPGWLASLPVYLQCAVEGPASLPPPALDPSTPAFTATRQALLAQVLGPEVTTTAWADLVDHLLADPDWPELGTHAPRLARAMVHVLPRGAQEGYRRLAVTSARLATLVPLQQPMVDEARAFLADPDVQTPYTAMMLLSRMGCSGATDLLLEIMERPRDRFTYRQAVWLVSQRVRRGDIDPAANGRLTVVLLRKWRDDPDAAQVELAELIGALPDGARQLFLRAAAQDGRDGFGYVLEHGEDLAPESADAVAPVLADSAYAGTWGEEGSDPELDRLVREAMAINETARRHLACQVLSASVYAVALGDAVLDLMGDPRAEPFVRHRGALLLEYVAQEPHRLRLERLTHDASTPVAVCAAHALGRLPWSATTDQHVRRSLPRQAGPRGAAHLFVLGLTGSPALETISATPTAPDWQRRAAQWWLRVGPTIR